eukprot:m.289627 g.289627  ORF g.289627 m.289627 type:complete len:235 (+) comp16376_c1_seq4:125-829(+)
MGEQGNSALDHVASEFATYEEFLDSQISPLDLYYLEDEELARQLVELGYRGRGEVVKREEFEAKKRAIEEAQLSKKAPPKELLSEGLDFGDNIFLEELAKREEPNRDGRMTTIIFLRYRNNRGQEISGYIDYAHRLKVDSKCEQYFKGEKLLVPKPNDLSYYNWDSQVSKSTTTANYDVITDKYAGMLFKNKKDRKIINVDPKAETGDNTTRTTIYSDLYEQVVFYDHETRRKA